MDVVIFCHADFALNIRHFFRHIDLLEMTLIRYAPCADILMPILTTRHFIRLYYDLRRRFRFRCLATLRYYGATRY